MKQVASQDERLVPTEPCLLIRTRWRRLVLGFACLTALSGCSSFFMPVSLSSFSESVIVERTEPLAPPDLRLTSHSDGLGWTVRLQQQVREYQAVQQTERWDGKRYPEGGNVGTMVAGALFCPMSTLYSIANAIGRPSHPSWDSLQEYCLGIGKLDVPHASPETVLHQRGTLDRRTKDTIYPVEDGILRLLWHLPGRDPIGIEQTLQDAASGTDLRVRWLADTMARNGILLNGDLQGYATLEYDPVDHHKVVAELALTADQLLSALRPTITRAPQSQWPKEIRIRLLQEAGPGISVQETRRLEASLIQAFLAHDIPSVVRGQALEQIRNQQQDILSPRYADSTVAPGQLTSASIIVNVTSWSMAKLGYVMDCRLISVATGQLLAHATLEDREGAWARLSDTASAIVLDLINGAPSAGRSGWMVGR